MRGEDAETDIHTNYKQQIVVDRNEKDTRAVALPTGAE